MRARRVLVQPVHGEPRVQFRIFTRLQVYQQYQSNYSNFSIGWVSFFCCIRDQLGWHPEALAKMPVIHFWFRHV